MGFRFLPKVVILNSILAIILCDFTKFGSIAAKYVKVVKVRPILSVAEL